MEEGVEHSCGEALAGRHYVLWWRSGNFRCIISECALTKLAYSTPGALKEHLLQVHRLEMRKASTLAERGRAAGAAAAERRDPAAERLAWMPEDPVVDRESLTAAKRKFRAASASCLQQIEGLEEKQVGEPEFMSEILDMHNAAKDHLHHLFSASTRKLLWWAEHKKNSAQEVAEEKVKKMQAAHEEDTLCKVCMTNPRNAVVLPCRHGLYCSKCLESIFKDNSKCPSCRKGIREILTYIT